ncbi:MAG TPA: MFS transporter, partial [Thermoleophilaceae bacterium]|nr:MFS transporter [Thermoleophilaceae bacterium]
YGMGMGGTVLAGLTAPRISDAWGLTAPFIVAAGLLIVVGVGFVLIARDPPVPRPAPLSIGASLSAFRGAGSARAWGLTLFYFLSFGGFVAMFLYLPKLLTSVFDLTKTDAGGRAAGFALLAVIARPAGGILSDRVGAERVLRWSFLATALLALCLAGTYKHIVTITIFCLALAVAFGLGTGAVFKLVAAWFPNRVGAVTGVVGAAGGLGGFFPPLAMGIVKDATGNYVLGFVLLALVAAICLATLARLSRVELRPVAGA